MTEPGRDPRYPAVELDPVRRTRVLAAGIPGAAVAEAVLDAPFEAVWEAATDFEGDVPKIEIFVGSARILSREGERLELEVKAPLRRPERMRVVLREGWCLMDSPSGIAVMAARPEGKGTRFAHLEAIRLPGGRFAGPLLRVKMWAVRELKRIERLAQARVR